MNGISNTGRQSCLSARTRHPKLTSYEHKDLTGSINNAGHVTLHATRIGTPPAGQLRLYPGASFVDSGTFVADDRTSIAGMGCCNPTPKFDNTGYFAVRPSGDRWLPYSI